MYIEIILIAVIIFFVLIYTNKINAKSVLNGSSNYADIFKEKDYEFLLLAKYGDKVYDAEEVYLKRIKTALLAMLAGFVLYLSNMSTMYLVLIFVLGFVVFKYPYLSLKRYYKNHLNEVDALLPYFLKGLEVLVQHYTVPVALAKSIEDAPAVFRPGLKQLCQKIEAGDSSIDPYMEFAQMYPVRDSMRMMRLLYRLGLGEQEKKQEQLVAFSKSVSSLQQKAREQKYKNRLNHMERQTMIMLVCTGVGSMILLLVSIFMMLGNII
jgi:hypothetical protein